MGDVISAWRFIKPFGPGSARTLVELKGSSHNVDSFLAKQDISVLLAFPQQYNFGSCLEVIAKAAMGSGE
jgi:hypothetical protein